MAKKNLIKTGLGIAVATIALVLPAAAENGVTADKIVIGQVAALSGPAAALGQGMREGILAAFAEANAAGGVKGHKLELISEDDGYEPAKSVTGAKKLINDDKVFALVGSVGTPTSAAVQPITTEIGMPFIGAFTGAEFLRDPYKPNVVNVRASYFQETETMVDHLINDLDATKIAIFYQDDAYGQAGLTGVKRALDARHMQLVAEGTYERNTTAVKGALLSIRKASPEAVIMIGAYLPTAEFIRLARQAKLGATFVSISFVGTEAFAKEVGPAGAGVVVTEVVPSPADASVAVVAKGQTALQSVTPGAKPNYVSLEGYIVGSLVVQALQKVPGEITHQAFLEAIGKSETFKMGGLDLTYGPDNNRGSSQVFLIVIQPDGTFRQVTRLTKSGS